MTGESGLEILTSSLNYLPPSSVPPLEAEMMKFVRSSHPTSLTVEQELKARVSGGPVPQQALCDLLATDHLLCLRLLSLANSPAFRRAQPFQDLSGAVSALGPRSIYERVRGLAEPRNYTAVFLGRSIASTVLQEMLLASALSSRLAALTSPEGPSAGTAYTGSALMGAGLLALASLRPNVYSACVLDGLIDQKAGFDVQLEKVFNRSRGGVAVAVATALSLPEELFKLIRLCDVPIWKKKQGLDKENKDSMAVAGSIFHGLKLAREICSFNGEEALSLAIRETQTKLDLSRKVLLPELVALPGIYMEQCARLGVRALRLPPYMPDAKELKREEKRSGKAGDEEKQHEAAAQPAPVVFKPASIYERMNSFLYELKACFRTRVSGNEFIRMPQAVYCTMQALIKGVGFNRACLLRFDRERNYIMPLFLLGRDHESFRYLLRSGESGDITHMPDLQACIQRRAIFHGDPLFPDCWPFVAFPVIFRGEVLGLFYADKAGASQEVPLDMQEQVACIALAEGWNEVPSDFC